MDTMQANKHSKNNIFSEDLYNEAKLLFSEGMVEHLSAGGLDIIESHGEGIYLYDINGKQFIDCYSGASTFNLGRKNMAATNALKSAVHQTDCGNFILVSEEKATLATKLAGFISGDLSCVLFTVVRGEAMDAACKLARGYTGKTELISVDGGWYGDTGFALGLSERPDKNQFGRLIPEQTIVEFNNIEAAEKAIKKNTAAFILEPVQAENGCRTADKKYLQELKKLCRRSGTLLIFDETQTGFGRTGYRFAKDYYGVDPDILLFGEAVTAGVFPMTGMVFTPAVKTFFDLHPLIHLCTFGGHDVGCRVAADMLDIYDEKCPWKEAGNSGGILMGHLRQLQQEHPDIIASVEGVGLLNAMGFKDQDLARAFCVAARNNGLFVVQGLVAKESVVFRPSLTITHGEMDLLMETITDVTKTVSQSAG